MFDANPGRKGAVVEVVDGGFIVTVMSGSHSLFGPQEESKRIFTKFRDAFEHLNAAIAPEENDADTLDKLERGFKDDPSGPDDFDPDGPSYADNHPDED